MIDTVIKDFKLTRRLGKGGMGEVWEAEQQVVHTRVAIKLLLGELSADKQHVQRFFNEAIAVSKIHHAGIVRIFDVGFHDGRAYLIMEYLDGETLAARLARAGRLPVGQAAEVVRQIASILDATHATGIVHRDLKPDNIFLVPDRELVSRERVKVVDFGIAKLASTTVTALTATGGSMGTPAYMAPEQWQDAAKADARADVYALGCVVFEALTGKVPFPGPSMAEACTQHLTQPAPRVRDRVADVPAELDALIARMLAKASGDRPAVADVLAAFARSASASSAALEVTQLPARSAAQLTDTTLGGASGVQVGAARARRRIAPWLALIVPAGAIAIYAATRGGNHAPDAPSASVAKPEPSPKPAPPPPDPNPFVAIAPAIPPVALGVADDRADPARRGFRPSRRVTSPEAPYQLQRHEVTWRELAPFLARAGAAADAPPWGKKDDLPATGMTWQVAFDYCQSIGATLPSEAQWEYAARGRALRPAPWGDAPLDTAQTRAYAGDRAAPAAVETSAQDVTPDGIHDLAGNVREWTRDLFVEDTPGHDDLYEGDTKVRAVRGLPLDAPASERAAQAGDIAAYRSSLCSAGPCADKGRTRRLYVGFRCAR